jgi:hypothetical protein
MAEQPQLFSPQPPENRPDNGPGGARLQQRVQPSAVERQASSAMARIETIIRILVRLYLGAIVLVLPWLSFWTQNNLFTYSPALMWLADNGFARGLVSGLGLLNIILAVMETKRSRVLS